MPLHALAPDQRAVVQLVLQRERSYEQIAELLKISEDAVRARAHAGLSALAPDVELPADELGQISDFLLGQQNGKPRQATRQLLGSSDGAREWAETVRAQLADVNGATLPELPELPEAEQETPISVPATAEETAEAPAAQDAPAPRPRPLRDKPRTPAAGGPAAPGPTAVAAASSRLGGAVLIGLAVLAIVVVVLVLFVFNGDDPTNTAGKGTPTPTPTASASATPSPVGQIALTGAGAAAKAKGVLALYVQGNQQLLFALQVQGIPPTPKGSKYALWLSGPGSRAKWLGDVPDVGKNGVLQVQGPRADDKTFTQDIGSYRQVLVTRETGSARKRPGATLASGNVPRA
jgi:hypothetical protein